MGNMSFGKRFFGKLKKNGLGPFLNQHESPIHTIVTLILSPSTAVRDPPRYVQIPKHPFPEMFRCPPGHRLIALRKPFSRCHVPHPCAILFPDV